MNRDDALQREKNRGVLARQVLDNEIYREAFGVLRAQLIDGFTQTKFKDSDERDEIWRKMQTVDYIEGHLKEVMETGKIAEATLAQKIKKVVGL